MAGIVSTNRALRITITKKNLRPDPNLTHHRGTFWELGGGRSKLSERINGGPTALSG